MIKQTRSEILESLIQFNDALVELANGITEQNEMLKESLLIPNSKFFEGDTVVYIPNRKIPPFVIGARLYNPTTVKWFYADAADNNATYEEKYLMLN